jgi:hypothetical protein
MDTVDFYVVIESEGLQNKIAVEVKSSGELRYARMAIQQLSASVVNNQCSYGIFLAPYISPQSAELCVKSSIGTIDFSGNCRISFDHIYIESEGKPNKFAVKRDIRSLYSPKASRVLRVLLINPQKSWKIQELAYEADVSLGQVANVKKLLADREWLDENNWGMLLLKPADLLAEWSNNYSYDKNSVHDYYSLKQPADIENELANFCLNNNIKYALTGFSGANRTAPSVRQQRVMAYVSEISESLENALQLKKVNSGANVSLLVPYDDGVFYRSESENNNINIRVVSPIQLYLDLKNFKGRGEEAAETIFNQVIKNTW